MPFDVYSQAGADAKFLTEVDGGNPDAAPLPVALRRGTAAEWAAADPVLSAGEPGVDLTTGEQRIGDGVTAWSDLAPPPTPATPDPLAAAPSTPTPLAPGRSLVELDASGALLRGNGATLERSIDNGDTWEPVHTFPRPPAGARQLDDGELLVATSDDYPTSTVKAALWRSTGYPTGDLSWAKVLEASGFRQSLALTWGFGGSGSTYAVSEYDYKALGSRSANQRAWITTDAGVSWTQIYDHGNGGLSSRHIHGVSADPYRPGTVWLTLGDYTGDASGDRRIRVSRDNGATWADVTTEHQPTAIMCFPNVVAFGTDNAPNGIIAIVNPWDEPASMRLIDAYRINDRRDAGGFATLTHVAERPHRSVSDTGNLTLLPFTSAVAGEAGLVLASYDGRVWSEVWRDTRTYGPTKGPSVAIGPTLDNRLLVEGSDAAGRFSDSTPLAATPGVVGAAVRVGNGAARATPRRATVIYSIAGGQVPAWTMQPTILNAVQPSFRDDVGGLFTRASDGSGVIVNRSALVDIVVDTGTAGRAGWANYITVDGVILAEEIGRSRISTKLYIQAGKKIAAQFNPQSSSTTPLVGCIAMTLDAWERHV